MGSKEKRATIRLGFVFGTQDMDEGGNIVQDRVVSVWGGSMTNLDPDEAIYIENALNAECGDEMDAVIKKARAVLAKIGVDSMTEGNLLSSSSGGRQKA